MSYILDALRKADAQRERDPARGIHAQPVRLDVREPPMQERYRTGWWAAGAAGVAALAFAGWTLFQEKGAAPMPPPARSEVAVATPPPPSVVPPAPPPATAVLPPPVVVAPPVVAPPPVVTAPAAAAKAAVQAAPAAVVPASGKPAVTAASPARAAPAAQAAAPSPAPAPAPAPAAQVAADAAAPIAGLPPDAPKLAISGGVYSTNAAQRMLIVNGQVFNEGGEVGPGLVLEEIRPKAAVLRFRGLRYTVSY